MKKLIILSLMIVSAVSVDAQRKRTRTATSQGNVAVGLGIGLNYQKEDPDLDRETKTTGVSFNPSVGYMVVDNLELGVDLGIGNNRKEATDSISPVLVQTITKSTNVNFGVYLKKYFPLNNWFAFTTSAMINLSTGTYSMDNLHGSVTYPVTSMTGNTSGVGAGINFGMAFTPYNAFALQANIAGFGVNTTKNDPDGVNNATNTTNVGFNVMRNTASLDFVWYFGRGLWKK